MDQEKERPVRVLRDTEEVDTYILFAKKKGLFFNLSGVENY